MVVATFSALVLAALVCWFVVRLVLSAFLPEARRRVGEWLPRKTPTRLDVLMAELAYWGLARLVLFVVLVLLVYVFAFTFFRGLSEMLWG